MGELGTRYGEVEAGAVQLFVLAALIAVQVVAVAAVLELVERGWLHRG